MRQTKELKRVVGLVNTRHFNPTIKEYEIIIAALEGDVIRQRNHIHKSEPAFRVWLEDTEDLLHRLRLSYMNKRTIREIAKQSQRYVR